MADLLQRLLGLDGSVETALPDTLPARRTFLDAVAAAAEGPLPAVDPATLSGSTPDGLFDLHNLWGEYRLAPPEERPDVAARAARILRAPAPFDVGWAELAEGLLPRVRGRFQHAQSELQLRLATGASSSGAHPLGFFAEDWLIDLVRDLPDTIVPVDSSTLGRLGVDVATAAGRAMQNLRGWHERPFRRVSPGVFEGPESNDYAASFLLLQEHVRALPLRGRPVAVLPTPLVVVITGEDDVDGLELALAAAEAATEQPRRGTLRPVVLGARAWEPWIPPDGHPLTIRTRRLRHVDHAWQAGAQAELLGALHQRQMFQVELPRVQVLEAASGQTLTRCVWSGRAAMLAEVDQVVLAEPTKGGARVSVAPWEELPQLFGGDWKPEPGLWPRRWRTPKDAVARVQARFGVKEVRG